MSTELTKNIGLRGVTVADTRISKVDGDRGTLMYRGFRIQELAEMTNFSEIVYLLLHGRLPQAEELDETQAALREARPLPPEILTLLKSRLPAAEPMDVLQGAIAALADHDPDKNEPNRAATSRSALRLISRVASVVAAWYHLREGRDVPEVNPEANHAAGFLQMLWGREPTEAEAHLMDVLLVLHAEHTFNASTFAMREVASTRAHLYASVAAGVGALSGPLHGGANARVMGMLRDIGELSNVEPWVRKRIEAGERVMGLGHAVYKTEDPRARILNYVAQNTLKGTPNEKWFRLALEVEQVSRRLLRELKGLDLYPNVDFYSGGVLSALGIPDDFFPAFFAVSRVSGWSAHYLEEYYAEAQPKPALYRPRANYIGRYCGPQGCRYTPPEARGAGCPCGKDMVGCDEELAVAEP